MKKKLPWMFNLLILSASAFAKGITAKGISADAKTGETLPAVNNRLMLGICQQETKLNRVSIKHLKF